MSVLKQLGLTTSDREKSLLGRLDKTASAYVLVGGLGSVALKWAKAGRAKLTYTVSVYGSDDIYDDIQAWVLANTPRGRLRSLTARSAISDRVERYDGAQSLSERRASEQLRLSYDGTREQTVSVDGHRVRVQISKPEISKGDDVAELTRWLRTMERVTFTTTTEAARDAVNALLESLIEDRKARARRPTVRVVERWGEWRSRDDLPPRPLNSVVLAPGQSERLVLDLGSFLSAEDAYFRRSLPWHRGYLLHGPPGTGKTSVARALAHHFGLDLWFLPLADVQKDADLSRLVSAVSPRSMLLLEDIDVFHSATDRNDDAPGATLSGLLNALDGVLTPHGLVTVMTTNDRSKLDSALVRPGRVDVCEEIGYLCAVQAGRLFSCFYDANLAPDLGDWESARMAPAELVEVMKRHDTDPYGAELEITGLLNTPVNR